MQIRHFTCREVFLSSFLILFSLLDNQALCQVNDGLIFEINHEDLEKPSYLIGTIHMICPDDFRMRSDIATLFDDVKQLVLELDMDDPNLNADMQKLSINAGMKNLLKEIPKDQQEKIDEWFKANYSLGIDQLGIMKPFALYSMMLPKLMDCESVVSLELELMKLASKKKIDIEGLETLEFQMKIFDNISYSEQVSWMLNIIENEQQYKKEINELMLAYNKEDLSKLQELTINSPEFQDHLDVMLYNRNKNWIANIEEYIQSNPSIIAVGAGHLGGEKGLVKLLQDKGYEVKQIPMNP